MRIPNNCKIFCFDTLFKTVESLPECSMSNISYPTKLRRDIETIPLQGKLVISYDPESNLMLSRTCVYLPKAQHEANSFFMHIS